MTPEAEEKDMSSIEGLGPSRIETLKEIGIINLRDLAEADPSEIAEVIEGPGLTEEEFQDWIDQADEMAGEKEVVEKAEAPETSVRTLKEDIGGKREETDTAVNSMNQGVKDIQSSIENFRGEMSDMRSDVAAAVQEMESGIAEIQSGVQEKREDIQSKREGIEEAKEIFQSGVEDIQDAMRGFGDKVKDFRGEMKAYVDRFYYG